MKPMVRPEYLLRSNALPASIRGAAESLQHGGERSDRSVALKTATSGRGSANAPRGSHEFVSRREIVFRVTPKSHHVRWSTRTVTADEPRNWYWMTSSIGAQHRILQRNVHHGIARAGESIPRSRRRTSSTRGSSFGPSVGRVDVKTTHRARRIDSYSSLDGSNTDASTEYRDRSC